MPKKKKSGGSGPVVGKGLDKSRALNIMGFTTARPLEACYGKPDKARELLDEALFKKTQEFLHGGETLDVNPKKDNKGRRRSTSRRRSSARGGDDEEEEVNLYALRMETLTVAEKTNILHESYQFLVKKYVPKDERDRMKAEKEAAEESYLEDKIDSALDFSHLA